MVIEFGVEVYLASVWCVFAYTYGSISFLGRPKSTILYNSGAMSSVDDS